MTIHPKHIQVSQYYSDMRLLVSRCSSDKYDAIVCLKRSGFIVGAYLSFQTGIPLFVTSEIGVIPSKFERVLLLDDKVYSGKSIRGWQAKLELMDKKVTTAAMYLQHEYHTDIYVRDLGCQHTMFYELAG